MSLENQSKDIFKLRDFATYALAYNSRRVFIYEDRDFTTIAMVAPTLEVCMLIFDKKHTIKSKSETLEFDMKVNKLNVSVYATSDTAALYDMLGSLSEKWRGRGADIRDADGFITLVPGRNGHYQNRKRLIKRRMTDMVYNHMRASNASIADWEITCYSSDTDSDMAQSIIAAFALEDEKINVSWTMYSTNIIGQANGQICATREEFKIFDITDSLIQSIAPNHKSYHGNWLARIILSITDSHNSASSGRVNAPYLWDEDY